MNDQFVKLYGELEARHWWFLARRQIVQAAVQRYAVPRPQQGSHLLEIGCGAGHNLVPFLADYTCVGIEPEDLLREQARQVTQRPITPGLLPDGLGLGEQRFEVILLLDVLEHVDDDRRSLATIYRHLAPGGWLFLNVPALMWLWSVHDTMNMHQRRYHFADLQEKLTSAGFELASLHYWGKSLALPAALARKLKKHHDIAGGQQLVQVPPPLLNALARRIVLLDHHCLSWWRRLPGLSLFAAVRKPA